MDKKDIRTNKAGQCGIRPVLTLIGGILVHLTLGSFFTFGNLETYIISYLRLMSGQPSVRNVDSMWITNVQTLPCIAGQLLAGICEKRFGFRATIIIGCAIFTAGLGLTYFTIQESLFLVTLTYGFVAAFGAGVGLTYFTIQESLFLVTLTYGFISAFGSSFAYCIPIQSSVKWFPQRPGLAIGIIMCGFGGGTLIFNQVITAYINPHNIPPDFIAEDGERYFTNKELLHRVPHIFLIMAAMKLGMQAIGIPLMSVPKETVTLHIQDPESGDKATHVNEKNETSALIEKEPPLDLNENSVDRSDPDVPVTTILKQLLKKRNSYVIFTFVFMMFAAKQYPIALYKAYGQTFIHDDSYLALVGSLSAIFNCIFRPFWGIMYDKLGFQVTSKLLSAIFVCIMCSLTQTERLGKVAFMVWICASYGAFCGTYPVSASQIAKIFGSSNMVIDLSLLSVAISFACLFGGLTGIVFKDMVGWDGLFLLAGFIASMGFFVTFLYKEDPPKPKPKQNGFTNH